MTIEIDSSNKSTLDEAIANALGVRVQFSNGCWLDLSADNGVFWGVCPYGQTWACNCDDGYIDTIKKWLGYWEEDRTESGDLVQRDIQIA